MSYSQRVARDFSTAAQQYDEFAQLQRLVVDGLLPWVPSNLSKVLDAGAGTGYAMQEGWLALDIAEGMCRMNEKSICADMQMMPLADSSVEAIFSALAMQWLADLPAFLREAHRCVQQVGGLVIATLGPKTLQSLRDSFMKAGLTAPLLPFQTLEQLQQEMQKAGWAIVREEVEMLTTSQDSVQSLLINLKGLGARNKVTHSAGLKGRKWLEVLENHYPARLKINIEWEVIKKKAKKI